MKPFFTETILNRGKTYFEQNRVFSVNQYDNQTYTGIILGNEAYHAKITLDKHYDVMSATCDCPYAKEGKHCKHEAALYFAIEDRIPKDDPQYFDAKEFFNTVKGNRRDSFYTDYAFTDVYEEYLDSLRDFYDEGKLDITQFQRTIDNLLEIAYPQSYVHSLYCMTFEYYEDFLKDDLNKEKTYMWLKEKIKYKRYIDIYEYLESIIACLDFKQQLSIYQEVLKNKYIPKILNKYIRIVKKNYLDMEEYLNKVKGCKESETYVIEMIRYYLNHKGTRLANLYYKNHKQIIKSKDGKIKIQSLMQKGHEKDYYNYLIELNDLSYGQEVKNAYCKIKEFYGNRYINEFIELVEENCDEYRTAHILSNVNDNQQLCYYLLKKANYRLFDNFSLVIKHYSFEMYCMIALECLKNYSKLRSGINNFDNNVRVIVRQLDYMAKVEFIDILKQAYVGNNKYIQLLNQCLEGDENEYDDDIQY